MIVMTSTKVRQNFGEFLDKGSREIIIVKRQNREVGAFVPMADLEKLRKIKARDLEAVALSISEEATRNGMNESLLADILAEVNPS
jgi:hypothetical protein